MRVSSQLRFALVLIAVLVLGITEANACDCPCDDDADCGGGQLCNPDTGNCENPTDDCTTDADCLDGSFCNGTEICDRFAGCLPGQEVFCDDGANVCLGGVCDEEIQGCTPIPQNDGEACGGFEGDMCVVSAVCADGDCVVTPLCNESCERCDPAGCASLCGNPFGTATDVLNTTDALFSLRASVALEQCELCICDVNGDGVVTASDVLLMLRKIVGLSQAFVCAND